MEVGGDPPGTTFSESGQIYLRGLHRRQFDLPAGGLFALWESGAGLRQQTFDLRHEYALNDGVLIDPTRTRESTTLFGSFTLHSPGGQLSLGPSLVWRRVEDDFTPLPPLPHLPEIPLASPHVEKSLSPSLSLSWEIAPGRWREILCA